MKTADGFQRGDITEKHCDTLMQSRDSFQGQLNSIHLHCKGAEAEISGTVLNIFT